MRVATLSLLSYLPVPGSTNCQAVMNTQGSGFDVSSNQISIEGLAELSAAAKRQSM